MLIERDKRDKSTSCSTKNTITSLVYMVYQLFNSKYYWVRFLGFAQPALIANSAEAIANCPT